MVQEQQQRRRRRRPASVADRLAAFLRRTFGLDAAEVSGIEGNAQVESGFRTTAYNAGEGAIGLFQWEGGRRTALQRYAAAHGLQETDLAAQEGYLAQELRGPYAGVLSLIRRSHDPGQVAAIWDVGPGGAGSGTGFENSSGAATAQRVADARAIYGRVSTGKPINQGGTATGGAAGFAGGATFTNFPGGNWDPLNWPGSIAGSAASAAGDVAGGILKVALPFVTKAVFLTGGLALVVVGLHRSTQPAREKAASTIAPVAAAL